MGTAELISLQLRMFLIMLAGLFFRKKHLISAEGKKNLTDLVIYLILPCNIVKSFLIEFDGNTLKNFGTVLLVSVLIQVVCAIFARLFYRRMEPGHRRVMQYATVASNAGFLGNPVAEGVFGSMGLALASVYLIPQRIVMWSAGVSYFTESSDRKGVFRRVITHPCIIAVAVGLVFMLGQVRLPSFLDAALKDISHCNTAMSMLVIGTILADVRPRDMLDPSIFLFSGLRLVLIPLLVYAGCLLCRVDPLVTGVSVLLAAMPAASTTAILAAKYDGDAVYASKCVVTTTVLSLLTTSLWSMVLLGAVPPCASDGSGYMRNVSGEAVYEAAAFADPEAGEEFLEGVISQLQDEMIFGDQDILTFSNGYLEAVDIKTPGTGRSEWIQRISPGWIRKKFFHRLRRGTAVFRSLCFGIS